MSLDFLSIPAKGAPNLLYAAPHPASKLAARTPHEAMIVSIDLGHDMEDHVKDRIDVKSNERFVGGFPVESVQHSTSPCACLERATCHS